MIESSYSRLIIIFGVYVCCVRALPTDIPLCGNVRSIFESKNLSTKIPETAVLGNSLAVCKTEYSCCTPDMESNLRVLVKKEYQSLLQRHVQSIQGTLASTAIYFQDYVHQMLLKAEKITLKIMNTAFNSATASTDNTVKTFFEDLNQYLNYSTEVENFKEEKASGNRLAQITNSLFVRIFPLIYSTGSFQKQSELNPEFRTCLQNKIADIRPFADQTKMLEKDISKTFEATKVLISSLNFGSQLLYQSNQLYLSTFNGQVCYDALLKMTYCNHCSGQSRSIKPCSGYCTNVMRGCLAQPAAEMDASWNGYYEAVDKLISLVNRGQSLVCLEDLLRSLPSRIAEPLLHFNKYRLMIHNKAKAVCGPSETNGSERDAAASNADQKDTYGVVPGVVVSTKLPGNHPDWHLNEEDSNFRSSLLTKKIHVFKEGVSKAKGFYANLADSFCADESFAEKRENASCWNGQRVAEYTTTVLPIALMSQKYNPEVSWVPQTSVDSNLIDLIEKLRSMKQLVLSQVTITPESDSLYQINEYGSGSGLNPGSSGQWTDDEDNDGDWDNYSGSGDGNVPTANVPEDSTHDDNNVGSKSVTVVPVDTENQNGNKAGFANRLTLNSLLLSTSFILAYNFKHVLTMS